MAETRDVEEVIDLVVLEQFVARFPQGSSQVGTVPLPSLAQAIQLAEDHLVACPGVSEPLPNLSLSNPSPHPSALIAC